MKIPIKLRGKFTIWKVNILEALFDLEDPNSKIDGSRDDDDHVDV